MLSSAAGARCAVSALDFENGELVATVRTALQDVEKILTIKMSGLEVLLGRKAPSVAHHTGVRLRPLFTVLAGQLGPRPNGPALVAAAAVIELVHLATQFHGEVQDDCPGGNADARNSRRRENDIAILAGDYLSAHASLLASTLGPDATRIVADTFAEVVTGQIRDKSGFQSQDPVEHYLHVAREKAGSSIGASCRFGGVFSNLSTGQVEQLARFGTTAGIVAHISDDIVATSSLLSRKDTSAGTSLREHLHTLPALYAMREGGAGAHRMSELSTRRVVSNVDAENALEQLSLSRGMHLAKATLRAYAGQADAQLSALPRGYAVDALCRLVNHLVERGG
ncbi:polyprenyl synthetase family protein [Nocardia beijingensis]|uniref:Polyprenyl synthetase family protein n=1 Tax=Nocardia beijingensis TaxID=95162 RepID=A0ABW7WR69_9NOCA